MRLVLQYQQSDGYTYSCTHTLPVEYESAEALLVDFMDEAEAALLAHRDLKFLGEAFRVDDFYQCLGEAPGRDRARQVEHDGVLRLAGLRYLPTPPSVFTLDEWFVRALGQVPVATPIHG